MAHFRGTLQGTRGEASRLGTKSSGLRVEAASWQGKVVTKLFEQDGKDFAEVWLLPHDGQGTSRQLYSGPVSGKVEA